LGAVRALCEIAEKGDLHATASVLEPVKCFPINTAFQRKTMSNLVGRSAKDADGKQLAKKRNAFHKSTTHRVVLLFKKRLPFARFAASFRDPRSVLLWL